MATPPPYSHNSLGDIRVTGIYTGFSGEMSTGLTFGLKLPTGDSTYPNFDADTEIGSGSTDLLLGAYQLFKFTDDGVWSGFAQITLDQPVLSLPNYLPGNEINAAIGAYYGGWSLGRHTKISPILEALFSFRGADELAEADVTDSGYRRVLIGPGVEVDYSQLRLYGDLEIPVYQYFNGNQLAAPIAYKFVAAYMF